MRSEGGRDKMPGRGGRQWRVGEGGEKECEGTGKNLLPNKVGWELFFQNGKL